MAVFYAHSGGVTSVINATACGLIQEANKHPELGPIYVGRNGILGALNEELFDMSKSLPEVINALRYTPGSAFGSCRYKLRDPEQQQNEFKRLLEVFSAHNINYFFYNGGNDSQDTTLKISRFFADNNYPLTCIGIPKTIDNDLPHTDTCPGFGSVAKYVAIAIQEAGLDIKSMAASSTKVFILEVMGRHTGWIAAAAGLAQRNEDEPPHIILFPEVAFNEEKFLAKVKDTVEKCGYCTIVAAEGVRNLNGEFLSDAGTKDAFGHSQLGGVASILAQKIQDKISYKYHYAIADYLQRSARHISSATDVQQAYELGKMAINYALQGESGSMLTIERLSDWPYKWQIGKISIDKVANLERKLPANYISEDGWHITDEAKRYLRPLILGEDYPPYSPDGLPLYLHFNEKLVPKKLSPWK